LPRRGELPRAQLLDFDRLPSSSDAVVAGLLLAIPDLVALDMPALVRAAGYSGTQAIPALNYVLSLLALKLVGMRRVSHVDDLAADPGAALFAGLTALPKATALTTYSYRGAHEQQRKFLAALDSSMITAGLTTPGTIDMSSVYKPMATTIGLLPNATLVADAFHVVQLANNMVGDLRRRVTFEHYGRRGRATDPEYTIKNLLVRGKEKLSHPAHHTLLCTLARPRRRRPADRRGVAWRAKEHLRAVIALSPTTPAWPPPATRSAGRSRSSAATTTSTSGSRRYLAGQMARCEQDLGRARMAVRYATSAREHYPDTHVRRIVMTTCQLAVSYIATGEVEHAAALGAHAVALMDGLRSSRALTWIYRLEGALLPYRRIPVAAGYLDAADSVIHGAGNLSPAAVSKILTP
jgi:hypothetical protein